MPVSDKNPIRLIRDLKAGLKRCASLCDELEDEIQVTLGAWHVDFHEVGKLQDERQRLEDENRGLEDVVEGLERTLKRLRSRLREMNKSRRQDG